MSVILLIVVIAWGLAAWIAIFIVVPSCMQSLFRHRLWRLRDGVVDRIRAGDFADAEPFRGLVHEIECAILAAPEVSPFRIGLLRAVGRDLLRTAKFDYFDPVKVHAADREVADEYYAGFRSAFYRQFLFGSPSGWLLLIMLSLLTFPVAVFRGVTRSVAVLAEAKTLTRNQLSAEADPERTLALLRGRHDRDGLSVCV
jgi:hypothetical protein